MSDQVRVCLTRCPLPPAEPQVHSLPCRVHHDGPAAIKTFFHPSPAAESDAEGGQSGALTAEFRGIQLQGERVDLRAMGLKGFVLEDSGLTHGEDDGRIWEVEHHFDEIVWWDVPGHSTSELHHLPTTLAHWSALSTAMHGGA